MKLILESIKALFRKVDITSRQVNTDISKILASLTNLSKRVNNAQTTANNAQTTANNAQTTANNAQTTANNAKTTANNAKTTANNAQTTANNAVKRITSTVELVFGDNSTPPIGVGESLSVSNKKYTSVDHKKGDTLILDVSFKYLNSNGNEVRVVLGFILTFKNYYGLTGIAMSTINDTPMIFVLDANNAGNGSATLMRIF